MSNLFMGHQCKYGVKDQHIIQLFKLPNLLLISGSHVSNNAHMNFVVYIPTRDQSPLYIHTSAGEWQYYLGERVHILFLGISFISTNNLLILQIVLMLKLRYWQNASIAEWGVDILCLCYWKSYEIQIFS